MRKFQSVKKDVEAEMLTRENVDELAAWCNGMAIEEIVSINGNEVALPAINYPTLRGNSRCSHGQYLVKGPDGFKTVGSCQFNGEYEQTSDDEPTFAGTNLLNEASNTLNMVFGPRKI